VHAVVVAGSSVALGYLADGPAWPDLLQARLSGRRPGVTVVNESIGATRLLLDNSAGPSVLARERTDLLAVSGVRTIVLADLINDIQQEPHEYQPVHITDGITTFVRLAHERHVRVVVSTIPPYGGFERFSRQGEACRQQVNDFVRRSGIPDAVLDLDALLRDPSEPDRLASRFDAGDHLHQTEAGQIAISEAIERVLRWAAGRRSGR
jgi:lysophospholipase L1-like esterase